VASVAAYGVAVALAGVAAIGAPGVIWLTVALLAASGSADMISSNYRNTVLQAAAPDEMRGRLQGVFTVVVAGGPRLGDFLIGSVAAVVGDAWAMVYGGAACVAGLALAASRRFLAYDSRMPEP
jgi:MFS family permease